MDQVDREFFKKYHRAVAKASGDDLEKVKAKIGSEFADEFRKKTGKKLEGDEFNRALENYLANELCFCDSVKVSGNGDELEVEIKGCHMCHGNEVLKAEGQQALCPIVPTGLFSISRVSGRRATLDEVRKHGVVGECEISYQIN